MCPLYNFAIFYDPNMEIAPGAAMDVFGRVHCNGNAYMGDGGGTLSMTLKDKNGNILNSGRILTAAGKILGGRYSGAGMNAGGGTVQMADSTGAYKSMARSGGTTSPGWLDSLDADWSHLGVGSVGWSCAGRRFGCHEVKSAHC